MAESDVEMKNEEINEEEMDEEPTLGDKEDSENKEEDLSGDGGVLKKILKKGEGWRTPEKGYEVIVHYVGKLLDGTVFDSSRNRNEEFRFKLGVGQVIKGWDKAVAKMKKGEISLVTCKPEYAYGEAGTGNIPPNSTLQFEVELINWIEEKDVSESKDGGVLKKILKEGDGWESPKDDCKAKISYKAKLLDGTVKEEKFDFEFVCGEDQVIPGLDMAVKSMKKGEQSLVTIKPAYYAGINFEVPSGESVQYEVDLVEFEKEKSSWDMSFEEKIETAIKRKAEGNELFSAQKYEKAIKKYKKSLDFFQYDSNLKDDQKAKAKEMKMPCYLNIAVSLMKTHKYREAIENCNKVLEIEKNHIKALFRRGTCHNELGDWDLARKDLDRALELDPENKDIKRELAKLKAKIKEQNEKDIKRELAKLKAKIKEQNEKDKKIFAGMFEKLASKDAKKTPKKSQEPPKEEQPKETPMEVSDPEKVATNASTSFVEVAN